MKKIYKGSKEIAIAWVDGYKPHSSIMPEIAQKRKLAEDITKAIDKYVRSAISFTIMENPVKSRRISSQLVNKTFKEFKDIMKYDL